jgi:membrane protein DedA with SNARE-associated domain
VSAESATTAFGLPAAFALLLGCEAGMPVPLPADLLMLVIGERVSAGTFPLWLAVVGVELVAVVGTAALLLATRGPARALLTRFGPRLGSPRTESRARRG